MKLTTKQKDTMVVRNSPYSWNYPYDVTASKWGAAAQAVSMQGLIPCLARPKNLFFY